MFNLSRNKVLTAIAAIIALAVLYFSGIALVDARIRSYLMSNPQIIAEMQQELASRQEEQAEARIRPLLRAHASEIFGDARDASIGPRDAMVSVAVFVDYQCGHCKAEAAPLVTELAQRYPGVRIVFKDLPIFGDASKEAARAGLAAAEQGKYLPYFTRMMASPVVTTATITRALTDSGVDTQRAAAFAARSELRAHIDDTAHLARTLGIAGTPTFVIGDALVLGTDRERIFALIEHPGAASARTGVTPRP